MDSSFPALPGSKTASAPGRDGRAPFEASPAIWGIIRFLQARRQLLQSREWTGKSVKIGLRSSFMQEIPSKTDDPKAPLRGQEFFELSLLDTANQLGTRYCVRQARAQWSEIDRAIMWDDEQRDYFWILNEAKRRYSERRLALAQMGFIYSDMDW
jgi:hypothetical protein